MKVGDKVIINPNILQGTESKYGYCFHNYMKKPGIFTLNEEYSNGGFEIGDYYYDEEWLLPVPLFKEGDKVRIREDLTIHDDVPFSVSHEMEELAGSTFTVVTVRHEDHHNSCFGFDECRYTLDGEARDWSWSSPMFDLTNYKIKSNESRLCIKETPFGGDSGRNPSSIRSRFNKARIAVQPLGYQKVFGRG